MKQEKNPNFEHKIEITPLENVLTAKSNDRVKDIKSQFALMPFSHDMSVNYIYIINSQKKLVGVVSIRDVLLAKIDESLSNLMVSAVIAEDEDATKSKIAHTALRYNLKAIPIVNQKDEFVGIVNSDQILRYLYEIQHKKTLKLAGIFPHLNVAHTSEEIGIGKSFLHRIGWIIIGLFGGIYGARLVSGFEHVLETNIILASFIPLIVYISDAVGTQTQTLFIRDTTLNPKIKIIHYIFKQFLITTMIAVICGFITWSVVSMGWGDSFIGIIIGIATATSVVTSTFIAILIPYLLVLAKQDPVDGGGPFATIVQDLSSIFVYFAIASILIF